MSVRLSVVQCVPDRQNTHRNWEYIYDVSRTVETDILVFPELMTSGYCYDSADELRSVAVEENNHRLQTLQDIA
ncbi:MAG: hypothetical protein JNL32_12725, partial [Candidatus Kapabacteria bacterium]|nr:hypothetical protein [Candidatus Kapabacteria bacterium]